MKERLEVSIGVNSSLEARQVVLIQPLVSNVKEELLDEKGIEVKGCRTTKVGGSTIGFKGSSVKVEAAIEIGLGLGLKLTINIELTNPTLYFFALITYTNTNTMT